MTTMRTYLSGLALLGGFLASAISGQVSATTTGTLIGSIGVNGQPTRAVLTRDDFKPDRAVVTRVMVIPAGAEQPLPLTAAMPYLIDVDASGGFERALDPGKYLVSLTTAKLELLDTDARIQVQTGEETLSLGAVSIEIAEGRQTPLHLSITSDSADRVPARLELTEPRGLSIDPGSNGAPASDQATTPSSDGSRTLALALAGSAAVLVVGVALLRWRRPRRIDSD